MPKTTPLNDCAAKEQIQALYDSVQSQFDGRMPPIENIHDRARRPRLIRQVLTASAGAIFLLAFSALAISIIPNRATETATTGGERNVTSPELIATDTLKEFIQVHGAAQPDPNNPDRILYTLRLTPSEPDDFRVTLSAFPQQPGDDTFGLTIAHDCGRVFGFGTLVIDSGDFRFIDGVQPDSDSLLGRNLKGRNCDGSESPAGFLALLDGNPQGTIDTDELSVFIGDNVMTFIPTPIDRPAQPTDFPNLRVDPLGAKAGQVIKVSAALQPVGETLELEHWSDATWRELGSIGVQEAFTDSASQAYRVVEVELPLNLQTGVYRVCTTNELAKSARCARFDITG